jgi:hypothetical protein
VLDGRLAHLDVIWVVVWHLQHGSEIARATALVFLQELCNGIKRNGHVTLVHQ